MHRIVQAADILDNAHAGHDLAVPCEAGVHIQHACTGNFMLPTDTHADIFGHTAQDL